MKDGGMRRYGSNSKYIVTGADLQVHSLAVALFLPISKIHWFNDVGYRHNPWTHCPSDNLSYENGRCLCPREDNFDENVSSCDLDNSD